MYSVSTMLPPGNSLNEKCQFVLMMMKVLLHLWLENVACECLEFVFALKDKMDK